MSPKAEGIISCNPSRKKYKTMYSAIQTVLFMNRKAWNAPPKPGSKYVPFISKNFTTNKCGDHWHVVVDRRNKHAPNTATNQTKNS